MSTGGRQAIDGRHTSPRFGGVNGKRTGHITSTPSRCSLDERRSNVSENEQGTLGFVGRPSKRSEIAQPIANGAPPQLAA